MKEIVELFVSHAHNDPLVRKLVQCLERYFKFQPSSLRCTSHQSYALPPEASSIRDWLRRELREATILALISRQSLQSPWCQAELGAAWGIGSDTFILTSPEVHPDEIPEQFSARDRIVLQAHKIDDIDRLLIALSNRLSWDKHSQKQRDKAIDEFAAWTAGMPRAFKDPKALNEAVDGLLRYTRDWRKIRTLLSSRLDDSAEGDNWTFICISPEAFTNWGQEIEDALRRGVNITIIASDTENRALERYFTLLNPNGVNGVIGSQKHFDPLFYGYLSKSRTLGGKGKLSLIKSPYVHFGIVAIIENDNPLTQSWGIVAPYIPYKWKIAEKSKGVGDCGILLEEGPIFDLYLRTTKQYVQSLLRERRMAQRGKEGLKRIRRVRTPGRHS
ncbi:MAG: toll/interleukin-1 receptor domain-containing protein [Nitrospira sp.]